MVSAELLAQLERRCREMMRDLSVAKYGRFSGEMRPFGGLNVILAGDLFQLQDFFFLSGVSFCNWGCKILDIILTIIGPSSHEVMKLYMP